MLHENRYALDVTWRPILKDLGISAANVLRRAGLPDDLLTQSSARLEAAAFHQFWESIEAELHDPLMPLRVCQAITPEAFSPPLFAALCSPTFLVAAQRIARYKTLVAPMRLEVVDTGHHVTLDLTWLDTVPSPPASLVVTELLFFVSLARMGTRELVHPVQVTTTVPPTPAAPYAAFLGVPITRGSHHRITFTTADAQRPFLTSNDGMWTAFEPALRARLAQLDAPVTVRQRVRSALLEALPSGLVAMELVARKLAMSKRTLQRHLESEGTTYLQLLQETREALADHYLRKTTLSAAEIAFLLGFEEPTSFYRAFRDWTGHTPDTVRQQRVDR